MFKSAADTNHGSDKTHSKDMPQHIYDSKLLFGQQKEIIIDHEGALYRLRITRQGKLILNK